ncbi:hypothetical protein M430DRAFT_186196 [Amorphotheca resinae ATCC 22711]|uniref:Uncharacterized protein n=1 Tax=Amorphotheca resinae ATCC 22711 TaxID=857342 RepID=A0A2T3AQG3_AMORE|nr:hypothetical protein M430DRAFT_186196 [Amorphotheca resinae ATCC 22711]PSS08505.1 hypothetical protein M430DRAFT_186196 [Amorphotheca resinae ATCC 22711]
MRRFLSRTKIIRKKASHLILTTTPPLPPPFIPSPPFSSLRLSFPPEYYSHLNSHRRLQIPPPPTHTYAAVIPPLPIPRAILFFRHQSSPWS